MENSILSKILEVLKKLQVNKILEGRLYIQMVISLQVKD